MGRLLSVTCLALAFVLTGCSAGTKTMSARNTGSAPIFTESNLIGKTLYDVWDNGKPDGFVGLPLQFNAEGNLTYGAERILSTKKLLTNGTWSIDSDGVLGIYAPTPYEGDSDYAYYKLIEDSSSDHYGVCFAAKKSVATSCTKVNEYLLFDLSTAEKFITAN